MIVAGSFIAERMAGIAASVTATLGVHFRTQLHCMCLRDPHLLTSFSIFAEPAKMLDYLV